MSNPLLKDYVFQSSVKSDRIMTVPGTINKSIILWVLLAVSAFYSWTNLGVIIPFLFPILIGAFGLAVISAFKKTLSPFLSPLYAIGEGLVLGAISLSFERWCPGMVVNAVLLTVSVLFCMLASYKANILRATPRFKRVVIFSTFAIAFVYIIDLLLNIFGAGSFPYIHNSSILGIIINFAVVLIASFNLIIDFDLIENGVNYGAPKYMEWYGAFCLMTTLVWLYIEVLRLLSRLRD
ncbi:MAG: Bax inhibitor-1/YccA family protein [Endomicrobium sp.]|jgi:uncharacterized YccA/Bax inhibitor family protein|nr:Bax inhibitor-1/YccA family protein [Endomicrobium sp.]